MANAVFTMITTMIAATIMAYLGYLKSQPKESFQKEKLFSTYLSGIVIAILLVFLKVPIEIGEELIYFFIMQSGAIVYLERIFKWIWRSYLEPLFDRFNGD